MSQKIFIMAAIFSLIGCTSTTYVTPAASMTTYTTPLITKTTYTQQTLFHKK